MISPPPRSRLARIRAGSSRSPRMISPRRLSMSPVAMQARDSAESIIRLVVRSASCSVVIASSASGTMRAHFGRGGDDVLAQFRIAFLRHGGAADGAGRHRFLDLAELGLHQRVDLAADLAAGRRQQAEQADVLRQMVADARATAPSSAESQAAGRCPPAPAARSCPARRTSRRRRPASRRTGAAPPGGSARRGGSVRRSTPRPCSRRWPAPRAGRACVRRSASRRRAPPGRPSRPAPRRSGAGRSPCAWRSTSRSPVWVMFCVVAPQCTQPPCCSPTTRLSSQTSGTMVWPVRAKPSSMRARSIRFRAGRPWRSPRRRRRE